MSDKEQIVVEKAGRDDATILPRGMLSADKANLIMYNHRDLLEKLEDAAMRRLKRVDRCALTWFHPSSPVFEHAIMAIRDSTRVKLDRGGDHGFLTLLPRDPLRNLLSRYKPLQKFMGEYHFKPTELLFILLDDQDAYWRVNQVHRRIIYTLR